MLKSTLAFFFFFLCHTGGTWKFLEQGSNPHHSSHPNRCSDNTGSLAGCVTGELRAVISWFLLLMSSPVSGLQTWSILYHLAMVLGGKCCWTFILFQLHLLFFFLSRSGNNNLWECSGLYCLLSDQFSTTWRFWIKSVVTVIQRLPPHRIKLGCSQRVPQA